MKSQEQHKAGCSHAESSAFSIEFYHQIVWVLGLSFSNATSIIGNIQNIIALNCSNGINILSHRKKKISLKWSNFEYSQFLSENISQESNISRSNRQQHHKRVADVKVQLTYF